MTRTLAISAIALALASGACISAGEEDTLVFEADGGKADSVRPYGSFERELAEGEAGLTHLTLNEDRTYEASRVLADCEAESCIDDFAGTFKFASSNGKKFFVLYDADEEPAYSFEYKLDGDELSLRHTGTDSWFTLQRAEPKGLEITWADTGGSFEVVEGYDVIVRLPASPSTGYDWHVTSTNRTFGYPAESHFEESDDADGNEGFRVLTWRTQGPGPLSKVGTHHVGLEYREAAPEAAPYTTFDFTVKVLAAE